MPAVPTPQTPPRIRVSKTAHKHERADTENFTPEQYFSDTKRRSKLENSDFDRGLLKAFFDQSRHDEDGDARVSENYEVVQVNNSIHFSRLDYEDSARESLVGASAQRSVFAPLVDTGTNVAFVKEVERLKEAVPQLRLPDKEKARLEELLAEALAVANRGSSSRMLTFGQFLKSMSRSGEAAF